MSNEALVALLDIIPAFG